MARQSNAKRYVQFRTVRLCALARVRFGGFALRCPMRPNTRDDFWRYVDVRSRDECWLWTGARDKRMHYGVFKYHLRQYKAHRFSFEIASGAIPDGLDVLHRCDNPPCVNPAHLFLGTQADNNRDRDTKMRNSHGERNYFAKLNESDVRRIRDLHAQGVPQKDIAKEFNIDRHHVSDITNRRLWKSVK